MIIIENFQVIVPEKPQQGGSIKHVCVMFISDVVRREQTATFSSKKVFIDWQTEIFNL